MNICLDCLQKQKPWINKDMVILSAGQCQCSECGESKQLVCIYTESDERLLEYNMGLGIYFNHHWHIHSDKVYCLNFPGCLDELEITLRTLVVNLGWDRVRDRYMYIKGQEEGKPLAFRTHEEYEPYLDYRVVELKDGIGDRRIIIEPRVY